MQAPLLIPHPASRSDRSSGVFKTVKVLLLDTPPSDCEIIVQLIEGFPSIHAVDKLGDSSYLKIGALTGSTAVDVKRAIDVYDLNRPLSHIQKIELIKGDLCETAKA